MSTGRRALATAVAAVALLGAAALAVGAEGDGKAPKGAVRDKHGTADGGAAGDVDGAPSRAARCLSDEELTLMSSLAHRSEELEKKSREVEAREQRLADLESRLEKRIQVYTELQSSLRAEAERRLANARERQKGLAKIYESMSPSDAAARLAQMEREVAVEILRSMKGPAAGKVLASLDNDKAVDLSQGYVQPDATPDPPSASTNR